MALEALQANRYKTLEMRVLTFPSVDMVIAYVPIRIRYSCLVEVALITNKERLDLPIMTSEYLIAVKNPFLR